MDKLFIVDELFAHTYTSSFYNKSKFFDWERNEILNYDKIILTDKSLNKARLYKNKRLFAWLIESNIVTHDCYDFVKNNYNLFEKIFTHNKELLSLSNKFEFVPAGGCWVKEKDRAIYNKTNNVSIILSGKQFLIGQKLRHQIAENIQNIDKFGINYNYVNEKISGLRDYRYSIAVENCKVDYYFTEKLIDCFVTGTIPIYWGCPSIYEFFNIKGMYIFDNINELKNIIDNLTESDYNSKLKYINENYGLAKKYIIADDIIYEKLK